MALVAVVLNSFYPVKKTLNTANPRGEMERERSVEGGEDQAFELQARLCRTLSHPHRLRVLQVLRQGERSATELRELLEISRSLLSQHMARLREEGLVAIRLDGQRIFYRLTEPLVAEALELIRSALLRLDLRPEVGDDPVPNAPNYLEDAE